jgi:hypothetical protein
MQPVPGARIIALSEHVDYWNYLGWRDPFSDAAYSRRQQAYARKLNTRGPYTPQMIVDGVAEFVGSDSTRALAAIGSAARRPKLAITITRAGNQIQIEAPPLPNGKADLYVAFVQPAGEAAVAGGENAGRKLTHVSIVRHLLQPGRATANQPLKQSVAFLQQPNLGPILALASE